MEQYLMPKELDWDNLRLCLEHYEAESIFIRDKGGYNPDGSYRIKGLVKVKENLEGRKEGRKEGLLIFVKMILDYTLLSMMKKCSIFL